jgi:hypothetical protein
VPQSWQTCDGFTVPGGTGESELDHFEGEAAGCLPPWPWLQLMDASCGKIAPRQRILFSFLIVVQWRKVAALDSTGLVIHITARRGFGLLF